MKLNIDGHQMEMELISVPVEQESVEVFVAEDGNNITINLESEWLQGFLHTPKNIKITIEVI